LLTELDYLASYLTRVNEMASKGVHGSIALTETKQGLVGFTFSSLTSLSFFCAKRILPDHSE
jgi:hypothetical protein